MPTKVRTVYRCTDCGAEHLRWAGRCDTCGAWNSLVEETTAPSSAERARRPALPGGAPAATTRLGDVEGVEHGRLRTAIDEFDFVLGGGIVPGSMILIGGEPGIGKSTLLLQVAARLQERGQRTMYVSGEESPLQVRLRADRLAGNARDVELLAETRLETILATARSLAPHVVVIDSIQTMMTDELEGAPGSVGQVRECAARLMRYAKDSGAAVLVVGHVTKGGGIAGPKTLEHIVDTVLYFEGESSADHRVLRATKNRFGGVDEIGVFRMTEQGLVGVENPSELFLGQRHGAVPGSATTALMEGTRPLMVEVQGLAAKASFGTPQRVATGFDARRLALLLAVLDKRAGLPFWELDVFVNVVGGLRVREPAGDLAVAVALASSVYDRALPPDAVFFGEVGLAGEIRPVSQAERRIAEAEKMGMRSVYLAEHSLPAGTQGTGAAQRAALVVGVASVLVLFDRLFV